MCSTEFFQDGGERFLLAAINKVVTLAKSNAALNVISHESCSIPLMWANT